jgi:hypothetical protein
MPGFRERKASAVVSGVKPDMARTAQFARTDPSSTLMRRSNSTPMGVSISDASSNLSMLPRSGGLIPLVASNAQQLAWFGKLRALGTTRLA